MNFDNSGSASRHQFRELSEGGGGAVEQLGRQPAFLVTAVSDGGT